MKGRGREKGVNYCSRVVIAFCIVFRFANTIIVVLVVIIALLTIGNFYIYRTQDYVNSPEPATDPDSPTEVHKEYQIPETLRKQEPDLKPFSELEKKSPFPQISPTTLEPLPDPETTSHTEELQQRIVELEIRLQTLNKELAKRQFLSGNSLVLPLDESNTGRKH